MSSNEDIFCCGALCRLLAHRAIWGIVASGAKPTFDERARSLAFADLMGEVERMANDPLPLAQRAPRVAALERELDELHRVEEVLVAVAIAAGQPVYRSLSAPPAAVLGVRVADRISRAA